MKGSYAACTVADVARERCQGRSLGAMCRLGTSAVLSASSEPPSSRPRPRCYNRAIHNMGRDETLDAFVETLKVLVPIAKAVPLLGSSVEGSLEAAITIIESSQVRGSTS
jgi:hypothetical protein